MMKRFAAVGMAAALALGVAGSAVAGTKMAPVVEPEVVAPQPVMAVRSPWTGPYVGAQLGWGEARLRFRAPDNGGPAAIGSDTVRINRSGWLGGIHLGYLHDFGGFAAGVEGSYDAARIRFPGGARLREVAALKLRGGPTFDNAFVYAVVGGSHIRVRGGGESLSDSGWLAGLGAEVMLDENWRIGAEAAQHRIKNFDGTGARLRLNTIQARVSYRF